MTRISSKFTVDDLAVHVGERAEPAMARGFPQNGRVPEEATVPQEIDLVQGMFETARRTVTP